MNVKYYLAVISAFTIYGLFSLPLRAIEEFHSLDILLSRVSVSSVLLIIVSLLFRRKITVKNINMFRTFDSRTKTYLWAVNIGSALMLAINWYLFIYVMNNISVNATALAYMICPIITTVLSFIFLGDRLSLIQWIAVSLALFSCVLLTFGNFREFGYSFSVGLTYAIYLVLQKNNRQLDRFFTLAFQIIFATVLLSPLYLYQHAVPVKGMYYYDIILIIAALFTIIPMYLNVYSLNGLSSSTAGIFIYLNPVLAFLLAVFYFRENMPLIKSVSYSVVFFSVLLFNSRVILTLIRRSSAAKT